MADRPIAIVTGASTGIGLELAKCCAGDGYDLIIAANEPEIEAAAQELRQHDAQVETGTADLTTEEGVQQVWSAVRDRPVDALLANAGRGLGHGCLDQDLDKARQVVNLNIIGTISLIHKVGRQMRQRVKGKILITGSRSEEHTSELQSIMRIPYAVLC